MVKDQSQLPADYIGYGPMNPINDININRVVARNNPLEHGYADVIYDRLMREIIDFETTLNHDEEIGAYLSSFGQRIFIRIDNISYRNPYLIIFNGFNEDTKAKVRLVQHTSQISVLFEVATVTQGKEPRRIGFLPDKD